MTAGSFILAPLTHTATHRHSLTFRRIAQYT